ncbi:MAG: gamma-glutamylcyclotransferase [Planctomycetota bacterium]
MPGRRLYFAYGSNLDPVQMKRRCPGSDAVSAAFADGVALTFPVRSDGDWQGGVASIEPPHHVPPEEPQASLDGGVWGVLYEVTAGDLRSLDMYEAVDEGMYRRGELTVRRPPGHGADVAITYFAVRGFNEPAAPSTMYLAAIVRGAEYHGLPRAYLDRLRVVTTRC